STVLTVTAATLTSIAVTPANPSIAKGTTQQFTATGTYTDSTTQNLTSQVTWVSATPSVATITAAGLATGVATGTSTISATLTGITGTTVLTVTAASPALQVTGFKVQNGAIERSFIQFVDLTFNQSSGLDQIVASANDPDPTKARIRLVD